VKNRSYCLTMLCHGLQIGKDQKGDNQRDANCYQFNKIGFIGDISIFADTPEGMQKLLNVVQEFTAWCGMQISVKKTYVLVRLRTFLTEMGVFSLGETKFNAYG